VAQYDVDIEIALRGSQKITQLTKSIKALNKEVNEINKQSKLLGKELDKSFRVDSIQNYSKALNMAERALRNVASGTDAERRAVERVVRIRREANDALARQNRLIAQAVANQREVIATANAGFGMQGPAMPKDFFKLQGPKLPPGFTEAGRKPLGVSRSSTNRIGAAVSAGAFPLLFGGGAGMALGGALGGAISGTTFGPASIALQVLGGALDQFAARAVAAGQALNPLTANVDAVVQAAGYAGTSFQKLLTDLESSGDAAKALRLAAELMSITIGTDGVEALQDFGADTIKLGNEFEKAMTIMQVAVASLINSTGILKGIIGGIERFTLRPQIRRTLKAGGEDAERLEKTLGPVSFDTGEREFTEATYNLQRQLNEEKEKSIKLSAETASSAFTVAANTKKIAELDADITNKRVYSLERANIFQEAILEKSKKGANIKLIDLQRDTKLLNLQNRRNDLIEAANKKARVAADRENRAAERLEKKKQRAIEREEKKKQRAIERATKAVDRELERTDKAFERASSQLDAITQKHEDKMAFEREYSRLIEEGSTPAAAKQAVELKKQLLELDRVYEKQLEVVDAQILEAELAIQKLKTLEGITTEYEKQVKALDDLKKKRDELEGKKSKAKGAIEKDLAPETGADKIKAEMERVQGSLNALLDPANQVILAAQAIGDAFSESFRGLITGSMSAQEALANLFSRTADHFADMAAQMIAKAVQMKILGIALNMFSSATAGSFSQAPSDAAQSAGANAFSQPAVPFTLGFAEGGYVSGPTRALVGEGGQGEYIIPENRMRESMARYSRGARGSAVIPEAGGSGTSGEGGGTAVAAPIDVRYTVERINSVDYVTADQFQRGMQQAASQGAKQGEQQTLKRLQMSGSTRKRLGM
jgi:hypothetical protein